MIRTTALTLLGLMGCASAIMASPVNIALERPVTVSSFKDSSTPAFYAVDGISATSGGRWVSDPAESPPHWIEIELDGLYEVSQFKYWNGHFGEYQFPLSDFALQYWDGLQWQDVHSVADYANDGVVDISFPEVGVSERIRMLFLDGFDTTIVRMFELEVYGEPTSLQISDRSPARNDEVYNTDKPVYIDFNNPIQILDASAIKVLRHSDQTDTLSTTPSVDGNRLNLPAELSYGEDYTVIIPRGAIADAADSSPLAAEIFWDFQVVDPYPVLDNPEKSTPASGPVVLPFDREIELLDPSLISLIDEETGDLVDLTITVEEGRNLHMAHGELPEKNKYKFQIAAGAVRSVLSDTINNDLKGVVYTGPIAVLPTVTFNDGLEGFATAMDMGLIGDRKGRWDFRANDPKNDSVPGPSGDFTWIGIDVASEGDFAASPAIDFEAGIDYTLSVALQMSNNATLAVDLNTEALRDDENALPVTRTTTQYGTNRVWNFSFQPEQNGPQHLIFYYGTEGSYPRVRVDSVSVLRAVKPGVFIKSPDDGESFLDGETISVEIDAFGITAPLDSVQVFLDDRLIHTSSQNSFVVDINDYDPGEQKLRIEATDQRDVTAVKERTITVNFADGTLSPYIQYSLREDDNGIVSNGSYESSNDGYLRFRKADGTVWFSTPSLFLKAGESYQVQFDARSYSGELQNISLALEEDQTFPTEDTSPQTTYTVDSDSWTTYTSTINVSANGAYSLSFYNLDGPSYNTLLIDNIRIVGDFNAAPQVEFTQPSPGVRTLSGAKLTLQVDASDNDGEVERVEFRNGPILIGEVFQPPYRMEWNSIPSGDLTVTAVAFDNSGGYSETASVSLSALENPINMSTNLGTDEDEEWIRGTVYQDDGTLVVGGRIDPAFFTSVTPQSLSSAEAGEFGLIARFSEDGRTLLSVSIVGEAVADLARDADGNLYVAAGTTGMLKLNPDASSVLWHHASADFEIAEKRVHRIDVAADGTAAGLFSSKSDYGSQQLTAADIGIVAPDGTPTLPAMSGSGGTYTTDLAIDSSTHRVWIAGWKNFTTFEGTTNYPVDVPIAIARSYHPDNYNERVLRGYDWESDDRNERWLNRHKNNMADTRTQRVTIAPNGDVYFGFEYDGGNTPLRDDPYDLSTSVPFVGGDKHHTNEFTSTVPKVAVVRLDGQSGDFVTGQYMIPRLSSGGDNSFGLSAGQLLVDTAGRVHVTGGAASGSPMTFDPLPGQYSGGAIHWVLSPDLSTRELVTRWNHGGSLHAIAISPSGKVATAGSYSARYASYDDTLAVDDLFRHRPMMESRLGDSDAVMVVGDLSKTYSFTSGEHPRLFFTADDLPELRHRATTEPYASMVQKLKDMRFQDGYGDYKPFNPDSPYSVSQRAQVNAFLYVLTGDEAYAEASRTDVEWILANETMPWADPSLKGLSSYTMAARIAMAYDWCAFSSSWDDAFVFTVSKALVEMGEMIVEQGGTEQNTNIDSNWQGARGASGGIALLATDSQYDESLLESAYSRVRDHIDASVGTHPETRGWGSEGLGYTYFPYGMFIGPFGEAMDRLHQKDLRDETAISAVYRSIMAAPTAAINVYDFGGAKPDWVNDNMHIRGEGVYGQSFYYVDDSMRGAARWVYDRLHGNLAPDRARWDNTRAGTIWSFLHYPKDIQPQSPLEIYQWQESQIDQHGIGITSFRNQYQDADDIQAQFKARLFDSDGHDGPDGLGFRILGFNTAWAVGGGRSDPGRMINQTSLYSVEPGSQSSGDTNGYHGSIVGQPLVKVNGDGHIIGEMTINNLGVADHKRWFITDFDSASTGAAAAFVVADTSNDGTWWQMPTSPFNTVTTDGNSFTITAPDGATMQGTVLHPADATLTHGTRPRGSMFALQNGGSLAEISDENPRVEENNYVAVNGSGGDFLITMTLQPAGQSHPSVSRTSGTVADATVSVGTRTYSLLSDDVLYDGDTYSHPDAEIVFDAGDGVLSGAEASQQVAYSGAAVAPEVTPPAGSVFAGWDRRFDGVTRDMVVSAVYHPVESIPEAPQFLRGEAANNGTITLLWNDSSVGETGFTVQESEDGGTQWNTVATVDPDVESVQLADRQAQTTYHFRVRAEGSEAPSEWSDVYAITTPEANQPPVFLSTAPAIAHEGAFFTYDIMAEDPNDDSLSFELVDGPEWLSLYNSGGGLGLLAGTPTGETASVDVTISVTDGIHPPVEQAFTLAINTAPVITLDWPLQTPVYLQPQHGTYAEVSATDDKDSAITFEWAIVQGPEGSTVASPNSEATHLWFDRAGTYTVRINASDEEGAISNFDFTVLVDRQPDRQSADVLEFSNENPYVSAAAGFRDAEPDKQRVDADGDGSTDDTMLYHAFSTMDDEGNWQDPLNPAEAAATHAGRFFGGWAGVAADTSSFWTSGDPGINDSNNLNWRYFNSYYTELHAAVFWLAEDFRNVDPGSQVMLGGNAQLDIGIPEHDFVGSDDLRWLVRAGDRFLVSQSAIDDSSDGKTLRGFEIADEMWAEYQPTDPYDLDFDAANAVFDIPTEEVGPLQAVGFIIDTDGFDRRRYKLQISNFSLTAEVGEVYRSAPVISLTAAEAETSTPFAVAADVLFDPAASDQLGEWEVISGPGSVSFADPQAAQTTATADAAGEYVLRFTAMDDAVLSYRNQSVNVMPSASPAQQWQQNHFAHLDGGADHPNAEWSADPDKDGLTNLLEYALGGDPFAQGDANVPEMALQAIDGNHYLSMSIEKASDATDLSYIIEVSSDLLNWSHVEGIDVHTLSDNDQSLSVRDAVPYSDAAPRFIRLRVELP